MNRRDRLIPLLAFIIAMQTSGTAQQPSVSAPDSTPVLLPVNYRVTLVNRDGDRPLGELSCLTCSPKFSMDGVIETNAGLIPENKIPVSGTVSGSFRVEEDIVLFAYVISIRVPISSQVLTNDRGRLPTNLRFEDVRSSGTLRMKSGNTYSFFQSGGRNFSLRIVAEGGH